MPVNAIGTQMRDPINSGLTRWLLTVYIDVVVEMEREKRNPRESTRFSLFVENEQAGSGRDGRTGVAIPNS